MAQAGTPVSAPVASEPVQSGGDWWFRAAPYGWLTAVEGDVGVGPLTTPVDVSMQDTLDSLDMTFMGLFEAGYDRWSFGVDVIYGKLSQDIDAGGHIFDSFRFEQKQWFITRPSATASSTPATTTCRFSPVPVSPRSKWT